MDRFIRGLLAFAEISAYAFVGWTAGWYIGKGLRGVLDIADGLAHTGDELHALHTALDEQSAFARALMFSHAIPYPRGPDDRCPSWVAYADGSVRCGLGPGHEGPHRSAAAADA